MKKIIAISLCLAFFCNIASAKCDPKGWKEVTRLARGSYLWITLSNEKTFNGKFEYANDELLAVGIKKQNVISVKREHIKTVAVQRGTHPGKSFFAGLGLTVGFAFLLGTVMEAGSEGEDKGMFTLMLTVASIPVGIGVGALSLASDASKKMKVIYKSSYCPDISSIPLELPTYTFRYPDHAGNPQDPLLRSAFSTRHQCQFLPGF